MNPAKQLAVLSLCVIIVFGLLIVVGVFAVGDTNNLDIFELLNIEVCRKEDGLELEKVLPIETFFATLSLSSMCFLYSSWLHCQR